jgi:uncharacterized protein (TIRG00374 family)
MLLVTFAAQLTQTVSWFTCFFALLRFSAIPVIFRIRLIGESLAQINPANLIAGDSLKMVLLKRKLGLNFRESSVSLLLSRIMIFLASGIIFVTGLFLVFEHLDYGNLQVVLLIMSGAILLFSLYLLVTLHTERDIFENFSRFLKKCFPGKQFVLKLAGLLSEIDDDLFRFYNTRRGNFYLALFLALLHFIIGSLEYYVILHALGIDVGIFTCVLFDITSIALRAGAFFIPGQIGIEELANKISFSLAGIEGSHTWMTVSLLRRARQVFWIIAGYIAFLAISSKEINYQETGVMKDENAVCNI